VTHEFANHGVVLRKVSQVTPEHDRVTNLGETTRVHDLKGSAENFVRENHATLTSIIALPGFIHSA
jgi:hypothetical protein